VPADVARTLVPIVIVVPTPVDVSPPALEMVEMLVTMTVAIHPTIVVEHFLERLRSLEGETVDIV
jgi:hypothetical protein